MNSDLILLVDDETNIVQLVRLYLERDGFQVQAVGNGLDALKAVDTFHPALVVLDIMLPGLDGMEVVRRLRSDHNNVPVLMLTARDEDIDKILGLELGADDYMTKPFSPRELVARVRTVLRRSQGSMQYPNVLRAADLDIYLDSRRVNRSGASVELSRIEFNLLEILAQHPGQTFSRDQLLDRLHGIAFEGFERSIDAHVKNLRRKLEPDPRQPRYVLTVYGVGYKFNDEL
jgi:two-component system alkaline phosphatase synthesis response regulator PhoP